MSLIATDLVQYSETKKLTVEEYITLLDMKMREMRAIKKINDLL